MSRLEKAIELGERRAVSRAEGPDEKDKHSW